MVQLRALEIEDLDFLYALENDQSLWEVSETQTPFSKYTLREYIENAHLDIYQIKQVRFAITYKRAVVGCADLYDYNPKNKRVFVGIVVLREYQQKGIGYEALQALRQYAFSYLDIHQLTAYIAIDNVASKRLFEKAGFEKMALLKDWIFTQGKYKDVLLYQCMGKR